MTIKPTPQTQSDVDALLQRLFDEVIKQSRRAVKGAPPEQLSPEQKNIAALGLELSGMVIGAMVRQADALERIADLLEEQRDSSGNLLDTRSYAGK